MKKLILCVMICLFGVGFSLAQTLTSPDGNLVMDFHLSADKTPVYSLKYKGKDVIKESKMGFQIRPSFDFSKNFRIVDGKIGVCCHSGLAERNAEYHENSIFYRD